MIDVLGSLRDNDIPFTTLQPNVCMANLFAPWTAPRVAQDNVLPYPHPSAFATQWTASQDIGGATVEVFRREVKGSSHPIVSTKPLTGDEMAEAFSKGLERDIRYEPLDPEKFGEIVGEVVGTEAGQMMAGRYQTIFDNPDAFIPT